MAAVAYLAVFISSLSHFTFGNLWPNFGPILEWKRLEFETPNLTMVSPFDVAIYYPPNEESPRIFVTVPRFVEQNPMTLAEVTKEHRGGNRIVKPYPNEKWHVDVTKCPKKRLVSVYRTRFDKCGRMWVLDSGNDDIFLICRPQIMAFDLATNKLVHYFEFPDKVLEPRAILLNLVIDEGANCDDMFIYIADADTYSIIIYDVYNRDMWKITDKTMYPDPKFGTMEIAGTKFELMDGILGMELEKTYKKDRKLFYSGLNSGMMNWVYTSALKDKSRFNRTFLSNPDIFHNYKTERPSTSAPFAIDKSGTCYFGLTYERSLNCWHTDKPDYGNNIFYIYQNDLTMQFITGIKIVVNPKTQEEELWWLTMRLQILFAGEYDPNEVNYRIFMAPVATIKNYNNCK